MDTPKPQAASESWFAKFRRKRAEKKFFAETDRSDVFQWIYKTNKWGGQTSRSGKGSELDRTHRIREHLLPLLDSLQATSILDLPCGDLNWISTLDLSRYQYIGGDIVPELIERNRERFPQHTFHVLDICRDPLPDVDFVLMRDLLVHLSYADITLALDNLAASNIRYVGCTTFPDHERNADGLTGKHRRLNMRADPINWPQPLHSVPEGGVEGVSKDGKCLGVWSLDAIRASRAS